MAIQLRGELISTMQKNSKLQYLATLGGRERMTQSWQKFAVLSTRSPCFIVRHSFYQYVGQKTLGKRETLLTANLTTVQKLNLSSTSNNSTSEYN